MEHNVEIGYVKPPIDMYFSVSDHFILYHVPQKMYIHVKQLCIYCIPCCVF